MAIESGAGEPIIGLSLAQAIRLAGKLDDSRPDSPLTIYARRQDGTWVGASPAVIVANPGEEVNPSVLPPGYEDFPYFLELNVVEEVIEGRRQQRNVQQLSESEVTEVVIYYAEHDNWPHL